MYLISLHQRGLAGGVELADSVSLQEPVTSLRGSRHSIGRGSLADARAAETCTSSPLLKTCLKPSIKVHSLTVSDEPNLQSSNVQLNTDGFTSDKPQEWS